MDPIDAIIEAADHDAWRDVPRVVAGLYRELVVPAFKVAASHVGDRRRVFLDISTGDVAYDARPGGLAWFAIKQAAEDFLRGPAEAFAAAQRPLGGPHPLAASIVGGVLGSGLGYGGGYLAEKLLPNTFAPGKLRKTLAVAGGVAGALPGAAWAGVNAANPDEAGGGLESLTSPWPFAEKASRFDAIDLDPEGGLSKSSMGDSGAFYVPTIPVDAFNNAIWSDVAPPNPYGTKSPWGDNSQPLGTPAPAAAAVSGLLAGARAATGSPYVSPYHVALAAGLAGGQGYLAGAAAGRVLGALAGLSEPAQARLRRAGLWSGLIAGVAGSVFGQ